MQGKDLGKTSAGRLLEVPDVRVDRGSEKSQRTTDQLRF